MEDNMITCVVFDMDDTLYDERDYCKSGFHAVAAAVSKIKGLDTGQVFEHLWRNFEAGQYQNLFNSVFDELKISYDDDLIAEMVRVYRNHNPAIELPDDSRAVLEQLKRNYKLALITDGFLPAQQLKVQALGIEGCFDGIVYTEELGREYWKPSPAGFEKILNQLDVIGSECAYIADNAQKDFLAPNRLGFKTIQLKRPGRIHTALPASKDAAANYVITSITEVLAIVEEIE